MAVIGGFLTSSPASRLGTAEHTSLSSGRVYCELFLCPGSGTQNISEIGIWANSSSGQTTTFRLGIYTDTGDQSHPAALVTNSDSGEISIANNTTMAKYSVSYSTKPQLNGGTYYWLVLFTHDSYLHVSYESSGGTSVMDSATYPTWPDESALHSHTDQTNDWSIYAVYTAASATYTNTSSLDALIQRSGVTKTVSLDSLLKKEGIAKTLSLDSHLAVRKSLIASLDALIKKADRTSGAELDALLQIARSSTVSLDALVQAARTGSVSLDALVALAQSATISLDACLALARTGAIDVDAVLMAVRGGAVGLDAIIAINSALIAARRIIVAPRRIRTITS